MRRDWHILSARTLGALALPDACERCFWIRQKIGEPPSPFPSIFSHIDSYSKKVLHAVLAWRQRVPDWFMQFGLNGEPLKPPHFMWFKIPVLGGRLVLRGVPDEILLTPNGTLAIVDYKTARFREADSLRPLYEAQLNVYARIAERFQEPRPNYPFPCDVETLGLIYYDPVTEVDRADKVHAEGFLMEFRACWSPVARRDDWLDELIERAWAILSLPAPPLPNPACKVCEAYRAIASVMGDGS